MEQNITINEVDTKKLEIISKIIQIIDPILLFEIEKILFEFEINKNEEIEPLTEWEKRELDKGIESMKKGRVIPHEQVQIRINKFIENIQNDKSNTLIGSVIDYTEPFEPVEENSWEVLQ